jgi:hypothetical protein
LGPVIGTTVGAVQVRDRIGALDANRHRVTSKDLSGCTRVSIVSYQDIEGGEAKIGGYLGIPQGFEV